MKPRTFKPLATLPLLAVLLSIPASAQTAAPTAPTKGILTPEQIDAQWIEASHKYDAERSRLLADNARTIAQGPFRDDWESLATSQIPTWYDDAKFGIFIHWGLFSVPAWGNEWYSRNLYQQSEKEYAHHIATYGTQDKFGYKDFIPMFTMKNFDPNAWASLFKQAGARYVVPVAEHHDGFPLYNSGVTDWSAAKMGPHRDVFGDLATAVRAQGLHLGASSHRAEHDWFFDGGRSVNSDVNDPKYAAFYGPAQPRNLQGSEDLDLTHDFTYVSQAFRDDWLARTTEIVEKYHPDLIYFDWWVGQPDFRASERKFAAFYYDFAAQHHQPVVMNYKLDNMANDAGVHDIERGGLNEIPARHWQTDTSISNAGWGYLEHDTFKSPQTLIHNLVDVVSKNGNLLLNIGPRPDGTIPTEVRDTLLAMGKWLDQNGEAIYASRPWTHSGEGPTQLAAGTFQDRNQKPYTAEDFRFTTNQGNLYAIELGWPSTGQTVIHSLPTGKQTVTQVDLLGSSDKLSFTQSPDGLHITLPTKAPNDLAYTFRIHVQQ
jgi:alpha-L-fucosidase